ncbi:conserved hypothetical protein [gamma proteobacterium NOR5-3]|nr:conserved hypothetical protein [gamma proteobacterium NOR5-3]
MLLRRVAEHVRSQNWFAVVLDFIIVVVGVFIGIQVANWNEELAQEARDEVLLSRLGDDFAQIVDYAERKMPIRRSSTQSISELISTIRSGVDPGLTEVFQDQINAAVIAWVSFEMAATYDELVATGTLSRIRNPELRKTLNDYARQREADVFLLALAMEKRDEGIIEGAVQFRPVAGYDGPQHSVESYDWEKVKALEPHLQVILRNRTLRLDWWEREFATAKAALRLIKTELGALRSTDS